MTGATANDAPASPDARFSVAEGERIYAIGDPHGRADLFADLLALIEADNAARPERTTTVYVLGDIVDRGPASAPLVRRCRRYAEATDRFVVLKGNHEQVMHAVLAEGFDGLEQWLRMGGEATLLSFGVPSHVIDSGDREAIVASARRRIPRDTLAWLGGLPLYARSGNVLFVHAGVRPGVRLDRQQPDDLLWIGTEFRDFGGPHPFLVVHGHWVCEAQPEVRANRIGIDTGAYRTGRLTALGLEGSDRWFLTT